MLPFYTVGHSTRTLEEFVELLQAAEVTLLVDIRTVPKSRTNPQYNKDALPEHLAPFKIDYVQIAELGGLRSKSKDVESDINGFWNNQSFHNYADYALSDQFGDAYDELVELGQKHVVAIMCAEAVWWRCHRRIITDYLLLNGHAVIHLMGTGREQPASPTPGAERTEGAKVVYPAVDSEET